MDAGIESSGFVNVSQIVTASPMVRIFLGKALPGSRNIRAVSPGEAPKNDFYRVDPLGTSYAAVAG